MMSRASVLVLPTQLGFPMANRLLDRQVSLVDHLTSNATLFGDELNEPGDPSLQGIDQGVLRLEARHCCNKRIEKIVAIFPRTLEILGADQRLILREFVAAHRQTDISSLA